MKKLFSWGLCILFCMSWCCSACADAEACIPGPTCTPDMPKYQEHMHGGHHTGRAFDAAKWATQGSDAPCRLLYDEVQVAPDAVPYAFDGFETYVVIIGACDLHPAGWDVDEAEERLETIRGLQDAFFALSDFYFAYAPQSLENGNALISIVNQVVPMLDTYEVSRFDSSECSAYELWEVIADAWYAFDPKGSASADMEPTVEMVEFVLYE